MNTQPSSEASTDGQSPVWRRPKVVATTGVLGLALGLGLANGLSDTPEIRPGQAITSSDGVVGRFTTTAETNLPARTIQGVSRAEKKIYRERSAFQRLAEALGEHTPTVTVPVTSPVSVRLSECIFHSSVVLVSPAVQHQLQVHKLTSPVQGSSQRHPVTFEDAESHLVTCQVVTVGKPSYPHLANEAQAPMFQAVTFSTAG